jgi:hypothetical protein
MKNRYLVALSMMAIALGIAPAANAADVAALDFNLTSKPTDTTPSPHQQSDEADPEPLVIPDKATTAPLGSESKPDGVAKLPPPPPEAVAATRPPAVEPSTSAVAPTTPNATAQSNTAPEQSTGEQPTREQQPEERSRPAFQPTPVAQASPQPVAQASPQVTSQVTSYAAPAPSGSADGLSFDPAPIRVSPPSQPKATPRPVTPAATGLSASLHAFPELDALFQGDSNSLVARAVGSAEGTRTPMGDKTRAYRGHVDPGNGVWNLGTFSYQHGANSPEEADRRQIRRLRRQAETLRQAARAKGMQLTLEETLNGIDLANQSPRAALSRGGYIDRLKQARDMGLQGTDAVLWARTRAFLDPDTSRWNAPGLGNNVHSITSDQDRRLRAIARAIAANPNSFAQTAINPSGNLAEPANQSLSSNRPPTSQAEANADAIISLDLPPV